MKKHLHNSFRALFLSLAVLLSMPMQAVTVVIGGINYDLNAETKQATVILRRSVKYSGEVVIPESVEYGGTAYSVTSIGDWAFQGCSGLTSVTIPNSVTSIGGHTFDSCSGLTSVTIPNSVTSIGGEAFSGCDGLTSIVVEDGNPVYDSRNNCNAIIETATNTLHSGCKTTIIPNSVTSIWDYAFEGCSGLTSVTIPNSVTSIGYGAFMQCYDLTSVTIPSSVTSIGYGAFYSCLGLTSVTIGNGVESIGDCTFYNCSGLTSVTIPNSVTSIGGSAFWNCDGLTSVHISDIAAWCNIDFATYETNPLYYANHLYLNGEEVKDLVIPNSVTSIKNYAFEGCSGLTSVTIPNSVMSIGDYAFRYCSGLTSVTIGNGVESIGDRAFRNCSKLLDVYCYAENVPSTESNAFNGSNPENATLHVPDASIDSYKATAPWSSFGKIVALTPEETGIDELKGENGTENSAVYDLSGRRVQKAQKGVFIQNGKVMVR